MDEKYCFVIQPFQEIFDKRYEDIYDPAIRAAGLTPYRVDRDPSTKVPIEQIEKKIEEATICFADISIDNPNVWYELGFAFASGKDVIMVCDKQRTEFPFDVRHKSIIPYSNDSKRDFEDLEKQIKEKIRAYLSNQKAYRHSIATPLQEASGLQPFELTMLSIIIGEQKSIQNTVSTYTISQQMKNAGFTDAATGIGIRLLQNKNFIEGILDQDWNGNEFYACRLTAAGESFILSNLNLFELSLQKNIIQSPASPFDSTTSLPF